MGSFNTACVISGMPIQCDEKAKVIFLRETGEMGGSLCYPQDGYAPITMPIDGVYDDYNQYLIDTEQYNYQLLYTYLKKRAVKMELGENRFHDIAVDPDRLDVATIFRAVHEDRLFVKDMFGKESKIVVVAIHDTVWQKIMAMKISDWPNIHGLASIRKQMIDKYDDIWTDMDTLKNSFDDTDDPITKAKNEVTIDSMTSMRMSDLFRQEGVERIYDPRVVDYLDKESMYSIISMLSEFRLLQMLMMATNKVWFPTILAGQDVDHQNVINFHQTMVDVITEMKEAYDSEYDFDD